MDWTTDNFLDQLNKQTAIARTERQHQLGGDERTLYLLHELKQALGKFPAHHQNLAPCLLERKEYEDFYMEKIIYSTMEHVSVPVIVLIPKNGTGARPAVLACHGHGAGQLDAVGMDPKGNFLEDSGIHNRFAVELVRKGLLVVVPEIMGFGMRRMAKEMKQNPNHSSCATLSAQLLANGRTLAGMRVYEAMRALDYIQSRSDVLSDQIGAFGFSGGGLIAAYTAALDSRIKATVLCGWANTFAGSVLAMHHCIDNYLPSLLLHAEQPELIGLIAPRSLLIEAGEQDRIFPVAATEQAIDYLQQAYEALGCKQQFAYHIHAGGHEICGAQSFQWLADQLA